MINKINRREFLRKGMAGLALLAGLGLVSGCEELSGVIGKGEDDYNRGRGRDDFRFYDIGWKHMGQGDTKSLPVDLKKGSIYDLIFECSNDGPSDTISITIDNVEIGRYNSVPISLGGDGWYKSFDSKPYEFRANNDTAEVGIRILSADKYGVYPRCVHFIRRTE